MHGPSNRFAVRMTIRNGCQNMEPFDVLDGLKPEERVISSTYNSYPDVEKLVLKDKP